MAAAEIEPEQAFLAEDAPERGPGCKVRGCRCLAGACGCCLCLMLAGLSFVMPIVSDMAVQGFLAIDDFLVREYTGDGYDISNLTYKTWWPGCGKGRDGETVDRFDGGCGGGCFSEALPRAMQASFGDGLGRLVNYTSRPAEGVETITLAGWWIPARGEAVAAAPRVVIQHGFKDSSNRVRSLGLAHHMREIGFSVLLNDFRDHGYSGASQNHINEWGDAYVYDLLGAWDFLVDDPGGTLGGPMPSARVGLMGFSKGGFTTLNALGLESRVPAAWVDGAAFTPRAVFVRGLESTAASLGVSFAVPLLKDRLYAHVLAHASQFGVSLEKNLPEKNLPLGPDTQRPLFVTANRLDNTVPISESDKLLSMLQEATEKYSVQSHYFERGCESGAHCFDHLMEPEFYQATLCEFWKSALGENTSTC